MEQNLKARRHAHGRGQSAVGGQEIITTEGFFLELIIINWTIMGDGR